MLEIDPQGLAGSARPSSCDPASPIAEEPSASPEPGRLRMESMNSRQEWGQEAAVTRADAYLDVAKEPEVASTAAPRAAIEHAPSIFTFGEAETKWYGEANQLGLSATQSTEQPRDSRASEAGSRSHTPLNSPLPPLPKAVEPPPAGLAEDLDGPDFNVTRLMAQIISPVPESPEDIDV